MYGNIGMKNTYTIYKYVNGKKVILSHFHNLITNKLKQSLTESYGAEIHSVWFGDGNKEPSATDTELGHAKWSFSWNYSNIISLKAPTLPEDGTWNIECTAKIDANTSYTGTVSEVGIYCKDSGSLFLATHALIKDAEGNPMTITKTDTEVLYVDIHIQYCLSENGGFKWTPWYYYLLGSGSNSYVTLPALNALKVVMLRAYPDMMSNGYRTGDGVYLSNSFNTSTGVLTCSGGRFGTDNVTTQEYINAIGIIPSFWQQPSYDYYRPNLQIGYWTFPNQDIFPNQTLKNIRVGTGDGTTKDFDPPLYLWVKDSEKIYIDGVLKVRNVDYTCDNNNNRGNLSALHPSNFSIVKNMVRQPNLESWGMGVHPLKGGYNKVTHGGHDDRKVYLKWDKDHPLEWEINEDPQIGLAADYFQMESIENTAGSYTYWKNAVFILSYSIDGKAWEEAGRWTCTEDTTSATHKFEFSETISAKHWKLETDLTGCSAELKNGRFYTEKISYLQKNWKPISFKTAPASGAIITMEADIDRPMKNSNFLLDINPTFQL